MTNRHERVKRDPTLALQRRPQTLNWRRVPTQTTIHRQLQPSLHDNFFGTVPVWIWPRCLKSSVRHPPFLSCKWKNSWHECPKTYGGRDYLSTWSRHSSVLGHSCHEFCHLHDKNGGCRTEDFRHGGQIQTGTVPKNCRVNRAFICTSQNSFKVFDFRGTIK